MNLGEFITAYSPLTSATVAEHLAAIAANTSSGQTLFVSQINSVFDQPAKVVTRKAKRSAVPQPVTRQSLPQRDKLTKSVFARFEQPLIAVRQQADEVTVTQRIATTVAINRLANRTAVARRRG